MSAEKVKEGVFVGAQIRNLSKTRNFYLPWRMWKKIWLSFAEVVLKFLGNTKDSDYKTIVKNM